MDFLNPASNPTGFTIFILVIVAGSILWRVKWQGGLMTGGMSGGTPATALITGMGQTGMMVNNLPQLTFDLQVQLPGQAPYAARVTQTVPHAVLGMLAPGRTVAVVVSPKNAAKVKLDLQGTANLSAVGAAAAPAPGAPAGNVRSNDDLVATGAPVAATVVTIQETGQFFGTDPIVLLTLDVHAPAGTYQIQVGHRVPADKRPRLVPGTVLRAHLDPVERNALGVDWRAL